jgi:7,8-dihydropterin-6-yl-methyl-4-(beta-D-ribofuranosyl)aminobenzene 5'-phosphate synthase
MKKIAIWIITGLIIIVLGALIYFSIDFYTGKKKVDEYYQISKIDKIKEVSSTKNLEILPLIDWYTERDDLKGEAGVSYLVKTDESNILFDLGLNLKNEDPSPLLYNMKKLGVDLESIDTIVISHNHADHIGGQKWIGNKSFSLTNHQIELKDKRVFTPVPMTYPGLQPFFTEQPTSISKGVFTTGTLPSYLFFAGWTPEQSLAINVAGKGIVLVVGCGHHTVPRLIERVRQLFDEPIIGIVGGLHFPVSDSRINALGIPFQKLFGTGKPPWSFLTVEDVNGTTEVLQRLHPEIVALSPHDSCDVSLDIFREAFPSSFREIKVGRKLLVEGVYY